MTGVAQPRRWSWQALTGGGALLQEDSYRHLWLGRLFSHTALNAVLYTLLVAAVGNGSGTTIKSALFITAYLLPTATLGTVSGVLVDRLPKNLVMTGVNLVRFGLMFVVLSTNTEIWTVYLVALSFAVTSQFSGPAEAAALPHVVRPEQLMRANSTNNFGGLVSQVVGFTVLAPLFLNTVGMRPLFFSCAILFGASSIFFLGIQELGQHRVDVDSTIGAVRNVRRQFAEAWETLTRDVGAFMSVIIVVLASTASLVAVTLMPRFAQDVLDIPVQNSIFVFMPAAIGIVAGLRLVHWLESHVPKASLVGTGFALLATSFVGLALAAPLGNALDEINPAGLFDPGPFGDTSARIMVTVIFSTIAAFSYSVVGVASRALVNERMPVEFQGRIFAAQVVLGNLASIPPILLAGVLAEMFSVAPVMLMTTAILVAAAAWTFASAVARRDQASYAAD
jgi:MFS family permease